MTVTVSNWRKSVWFCNMRLTCIVGIGCVKKGLVEHVAVVLKDAGVI